MKSQYSNLTRRQLLLTVADEIGRYTLTHILKNFYLIRLIKYKRSNKYILKKCKKIFLITKDIKFFLK
jgi:hypothetical protein